VSYHWFILGISITRIKVVLTSRPLIATLSMLKKQSSCTRQSSIGDKDILKTNESAIIPLPHLSSLDLLILPAAADRGHLGGP